MSSVIELRSKNAVISDLASHLGGFKAHYLEAWWETDNGFPELPRSYTAADQAANGRKMDRVVSSLLSELKSYPAQAADREAWNRKLHEAVLAAGRFVLSLADGRLDILLSGGFIEVTDSFIKDAKRFNPRIALEDILQALRNVWIMNSVQVLLCERVRHTPAVFAYSMLYPYTDNLMDNNGISTVEKLKISERFKRRLAGQSLAPANSFERSVYSLVAMLEEQYPRVEYPLVYESLMAIHKAQETSLTQQSRGCSPYDADILGVSFDKGGASVLADACLVKGELSLEQAGHMFGFGIFLQLADDLQDVAGDLGNGHMTIFSQTAGRWSLDRLTNRLFNFIYRLTDSWICFSPGAAEELRNAIRYSCTLFLIAAIAQNEGFFTPSYLREIERYSPLSLSYIRKLFKNTVREYRRLERAYSGHGSEPFETVVSCAAAR